MKSNQRKPQYSNWVSKWILRSGCIVTVLLTAGGVVAFEFAGHTNWLCLALIGMAVLFCVFTIYMLAARGALSYEGGGIQSKVLDGVLSYLDVLHWNGEGKLLDIGCGSGAMSIKAAKNSRRRRSQAWITGVQAGTTPKNCARITQKPGVSHKLSSSRGMQRSWTLPMIHSTLLSATSSVCRGTRSVLRSRLGLEHI